MKYLITIVGPTAIGKTALSIKIAQHYNCAIVSCDSRQFFKEMAIGTAVPSAEELAAAPHYFIHNKSIYEAYTVGDYEKEAVETINGLFAANNFVVLVGGSGLYVDAVLKGFDAFPDVDPAVRKKVLQDYAEFGIAYLQQELKARDADYYKKLANENQQTLLNPQRLMRFVEVCIATGKPYSSFLNFKKNERNFTPIVIGLEAERMIMYNRINERVDSMIASGLIDEAQKLYPEKERNALQTVGYRELFEYFEGNVSLDQAIDEIKKNTRRFAKRQLTWFKRLDDTQWFDFKTPFNEVVDYINAKTEYKCR